MRALIRRAAMMASAVALGLGSAAAIIGTGTPAQAAVSYGPQVTLPFTGLGKPGGLAVDAAGDVYAADTANNQVVELPAAPGGGYGPQVDLPFTSLDGPTGLAVDAAGDVYVANAHSGQVLELPAAPGGGYGPQVTLPFTGLDQPEGVAVDAAGDVYVADTSNSRVVELPAAPGGGYGPQVTLPFASTGPLDEPFYPYELAVDAAGDVYAADDGNAQVVELPPGATSSSQQVTLPFAELVGNGVAVDAAGNVYDFVNDFPDYPVVELPAVPGGYGPQITLPITGLLGPTVVAVDAAGDIYVATSSSSARVVELPVLKQTATTLSSSADPSLYGQTVTYTATVTPTDGGGTVSFDDDGVPIAGCTAQPLSPPVTGTATATCQVTYTALGTHQITASYGGDAGYAPSTTVSALSQTVQETPAGLCQLTVSYVESSAKYQNLPPAAQAAINQTLTQVCTHLAAIIPQLTPGQLALAIAVYNAAVSALAHGGWLTSAQASTLTYLAGNLSIS